MKKFIRCGFAFLVVFIVMQPAAYSLDLKTIPISLTVSGDRATSFDVYTSRNGNVPLSAVALCSGGYQITDDIRYVGGKAYIDITPGNTGKWYLVVYTTNASTSEYNPEDHADLINSNDSSQIIKWKYRNSHIFGEFSQPVGAVIGNIFWEHPNYLEYKYFLNLSNGSGPDDITDDATLEWASIVHYKNLYNKPDGRIELLFGVDLTTTDQAGEYTSALTIEVYYKP